ncbi:MAG: calcium/sodium antiporter [Bacillota bacterium]|nr:calcium/sodium antiporter [Bacillota bacterium]
MAELIFWIAVFMISLAVLIKASDYFTEAAEKTGLHLKIPPFIVGATIVGLGTSLPELVSSILAVLSGATEIVVGNVVGSNIANILLVLGLTALLGKQIKLSYARSYADLSFLVGSALLITLAALDGRFTWPEGLLCTGGLFTYISAIIQRDRRLVIVGKTGEEGEPGKEKLDPKIILLLLVSPVFIYLGARYTVAAIIQLSEIFKIGKEVIAVSAVAIGTSLPELSVSLTAGLRGRPEIAVGNIFGSNIFNSFAVMGIPSLIKPLAIPGNIIAIGIPTMVGATILYFFVTQDAEISRWEGVLLLVFYGFFLGKLFNLF